MGVTPSKGGNVRSDQHLVFADNLSSPDGPVEHIGDDLVGGSGGDDQQIKVDLTGVPAHCERIMIAVLIYDADARGESFGQVRNAYIRIVNSADSAEIARYDLTEEASTETAMLFDEIYRHDSEWKFRAIGQGCSSGLAGIARDFGVSVG